MLAPVVAVLPLAHGAIGIWQHGTLMQVTTMRLILESWHRGTVYRDMIETLAY